jgi:hypothetical protein
MRGSGTAGAMSLLVRSHHQLFLVAIVMVVFCACVRTTTRVGPTVPLTIGDPRTACEREGWLELAPAETRQPGTMTVHGVGLFRPGQEHPEDIARVVDRLQEPTLQAKLARYQRTNATARRALYWSLGGLGGMAVGVGTAAALNDRNHAAANVFGIAGLALGLVGVIGAIVTMPWQDGVEAEVGQYLFVDPADLPAILRGTERADEAVRQACAASGRCD